MSSNSNLSEIFVSVSFGSHSWYHVSLLSWIWQLQLFLGMPREYPTWTHEHNLSSIAQWSAMAFLSYPGRPQAHSRRGLCYLGDCVQSSHLSLPLMKVASCRSLPLPQATIATAVYCAKVLRNSERARVILCPLRLSESWGHELPMQEWQVGVGWQW